MKLLLLVLALVACNSKGKAPATGSAAPVAPPVVTAGSAVPAGSAAVPPENDFCRIGIDAIDHASCGSASLQSARKSLETITATVQTTGTNDPHAYEVTCARLVDAIDRDAAKSGCTLQLDAGVRATIKKDVDEYYGQRTPVTPTGDAASDAVIKQVAAVRDTACACKDQACIDGADKKLVTIPAMPANAPQPAKDLATKLLDDASRCAQRVKMQ